MPRDLLLFVRSQFWIHVNIESVIIIDIFEYSSILFLFINLLKSPSSLETCNIPPLAGKIDYSGFIFADHQSTRHPWYKWFGSIWCELPDLYTWHINDLDLRQLQLNSNILMINYRQIKNVGSFTTRVMCNLTPDTLSESAMYVMRRGLKYIQSYTHTRVVKLF